jgi:ABC-2 type transport system permease protein
LSTAVKYIKFIAEFLKFNLQAAMEYRVSFISQVVFMFLNDLIFLSLWWIFFNRFREVKGWAMGDIILLFAVAATAFGIAVVVFGNAMRLSQVVREGGLDYYLALPKDPLLHTLVSRMNISGLGDAIFGVAIFFISGEVSLVKFTIFVGTVIVSTAIFTSFMVIVHSLSFFIGNSEGISTLMTEAIVTFSLYPRSIFTGAVKIVLFTIIPAGFMSYLPVSLIKEFNYPVLAGYLAFAAGITLLARWVFMKGLRRYESGNLVVARM